MIQRKFNNKKRLFVALVMMILFIAASCTAIQQQQFYHKYIMKGSIIHNTDDSIYLCIGSKDGATVGQELEVYKISQNFQMKAPAFKRVKTGKVKITEITDEHFATATIISGKAEKHDIVELTQ